MKVLVALLAFASLGAADILNVNSGVYFYSTESYDVKDSISSAIPVLSRSYSTAFSYTDPSQSGSLIEGSYSADASASYGVLRGRITSIQAGFPTFPLISVYTAAYFEDALTFFSNAPGGTWAFTFTIDGTGSGPNSSLFEGVHTDTWGGFYAGAVGTPHTPTFIDTTNTSVHVTVQSEPIPWSAGVPVAIEASLGPALSMTCNIGILSPCDFWNAAAVSDFGDTAILTGIELFDETGAPITNFSVKSQSGTQYTANGVVVPEPSSLELLTLVCALVFIALRRSQPRPES